MGWGWEREWDREEGRGWWGLTVMVPVAVVVMVIAGMDVVEQEQLVVMLDVVLDVVLVMVLE